MERKILDVCVRQNMVRTLSYIRRTRNFRSGPLSVCASCYSDTVRLALYDFGRHYYLCIRRSERTYSYIKRSAERGTLDHSLCARARTATPPDLRYKILHATLCASERFRISSCGQQNAKLQTTLCAWAVSDTARSVLYSECSLAISLFIIF